MPLTWLAARLVVFRFVWRFMMSSTLVCADTVSAITAVAAGGRERESIATNLNQSTGVL